MTKFLLGLLIVSASVVCFPAFAAPEAGNGLITQASKYNFAETISKIEAIFKSKGVTVFAKIDHAVEAEKVGLKMRPTQVLIFGNPKGGTPVMLATPSAAIDLPLKALIAEDEMGKVSVTFNSPAYLQGRHGIKDDLVKNISTAAVLIDLALQ